MKFLLCRHGPEPRPQKRFRGLLAIIRLRGA